MAESKNNVVIKGFSGKFGDMLVFRQKAGKTIAAKAPGARKGEATPAQQAVKDRFQRATVYGKAVTANAEAKEAYKAVATEGQTAYNVAIADFFNAPDIDTIDVSGYTGQPGDKIKVTVTDDFKVKAVMVSIHNADGSLLEEGEAEADVNGLDWIYTATIANPGLTGDKITVLATDLPDNLSTEEKTL